MMRFSIFWYMQANPELPPHPRFKKWKNADENTHILAYVYWNSCQIGA